jgi:hypothetical protein
VRQQRALENMRKTTSSKSVFLLVFLLAARPLQAQVPWNENGPAYLALARAACKELERVAELLAPFRMIVPLADGGGDGGGGDGGGGDGGSGGDGGGSGDGSSSADGSGNGDAGDTGEGVSADAADVGPGNPDSISDVAVDPTTNAIPDVPTNDPTMSLRGGASPSSPDLLASTQPPASLPIGAPPGPPFGPGGGTQDIAIHAVIISGAQSPWQAISKAPGVRNVTLTGGLISLGKTTQPGEPVAGGTPPPFLKIIPEPKLLNGSIIPPVVPNVIDVRIVGYSVRSEIPVK